ncbi:hypothetical protein CA54_18130 [Symmachiella macrocystis]|uniref:DUF2306 domain-containing protein n=1 Tax=Symmachiella macrocystis TaxID=2527985 RepID=A0A5C6BMN6_9PLAN|nr:DUF2306 domain-containing protein [Symmachiella macrocystis]TWU12987.1 hypothetical protein CA54_18130 [Symmachiella macrocystis]
MMKSAARVLGWSIMTLLALLVAITSFRYFSLNPDTYFEQNRAVYVDHPISLLSHIGGGVVAIVIGPFQFWKRFRNRHLQLHRFLGGVYLAATVGFGAIGGLFLAPHSYGGLSTHFGFGMLAALWLLTGTLAFWSILHGRVSQHREWMIRSYALTFAAVTLRLWIPVLVILGFEFEEVYQTVAWIAWVPNLIATECFLGMTKRSASHVSTSAVDK